MCKKDLVKNDVHKKDLDKKDLDKNDLNKKDLNKKDLEFFTSVVDTFNASGESIRDTSIRLHLSRTKVRKILITMGVMESEITEQALELLQTGMTQNEVAKRLNLSIATLSTYLPYGNRVYKREEKTAIAIRVEECRSRQHRAAKNQVITSGKVIRLEDYRQTKLKDLGNRKGKKVFQLRMELTRPNGPLGKEELSVLRSYAKVSSSLSRTILVPGEMTLYALHYAIQRSFGWENCHLHHFSYEKQVFQEVAGEKFGSWKKYCGQYFRFPYDTGAEMKDIYWNDDYQGKQSIKTWLKTKYNGPYSYEGQQEQYLMAQGRVRAFALSNEILEVGPSFAEYREGKRERKQIPVNEVKIENLRRFFPCGLNELLERLTVEEVLGLQVDVKKAKQRAEKIDAGFQEEFHRWQKTTGRMKREYSRLHTQKMLPLSDHILYDYDYGDDWRVKITCEEVYSCDATGKVFDSKSEEMTGEVQERILAVADELKPVGIAVDGRNVLDDVGGIDGYCEFLKSVYDPSFDAKESHGPFTDRESSLEWARGQGWNGRISKPEKLL